jgi:small subunit ribosomal protein S3
MKGEVYGKRELSPLVGLSKKGKGGPSGPGKGQGRNKPRR